VFTFALREPTLEHRVVWEARCEQNRTRYLFSSSRCTSVRRLGVGLAAARRGAPGLAEEVARVGWPGVEGRFKPVAQLAAGGWLAKHLRQQGIEHVHAPIASSATIAMFASMLTSIPFSFTVHGPPDFDQPERLSLAEKVHRAAFVRVISNWTAGEVVRRVDPTDWPRVHVIRCGPSAGNPARATTRIPEEHRILAVGVLTPRKGQAFLIHAMDRLISDGRRAHLTLVGDGPLRGELERAVRERGLEGVVELRGWTTNEELANLFASSRLFLMPSLAEGVPIAIIDAFVHGRPVISTSVGGISELVEHGTSGWLVPPASVKDLFDTIIEGLGTPTARLQDMARAGAARVAEAYDFASNAARLASMFSRASGC
jgi:colanic acid/amylovoran biosynthesis glycosyltransferase